MPASAPTAKHVARQRPFTAPYVFVLAVVDGVETTAVYRVARSDTRLGRGAEVDVVLADDEVSKHHCTVRYDAGRCHLVDEGSLNGTHVNGRRLVPGVTHPLRHLDEIRLGGTRLVFLTGRFKDRLAPER